MHQAHFSAGAAVESAPGRGLCNGAVRSDVCSDIISDDVSHTLCVVCSGPSFLQALLRSARLGGNSAMVLRAVLSAQADKVSQALNMRSGVEMRAARRTAERIGAQIVLGEQSSSPDGFHRVLLCECCRSPSDLLVQQGLPGA